MAGSPKVYHRFVMNAVPLGLKGEAGAVRLASEIEPAASGTIRVGDLIPLRKHLPFAI